MYSSRIEPRHFRRVLEYLLREWRLLLLTFLSGTLGFTVTFVFPWLIGALLDHVIAPPPVHGALPSMEERTWWLSRLGVAGIVTALLFSIAGYGRGHFNYKMGNRIVRTIRHDLMTHLQKLSLSFYTKEQSGKIVWSVMHDVHGINGLVHGGVLLLIIDLLQLLVAVGLLVRISAPLTAAVLLLLPLYAVTFRFFNPRLRRSSEEIHASMSMMSGRLQESVSGVALVKTLGGEAREVEKFQRLNTEHLRLVVSQSHLGHLMGAVSEFFIHLGTAVIIGYGGYLALHGPTPITAGDLARFVGYVGILYGPVARFATLNTVFQSSLVSVRKVFSILDIVPRVGEDADPLKAVPSFEAIRFDQVSFAYPSNETRTTPERGIRDLGVPEVVLRAVNLHASSGERVAIVGPSGSGKSTLVSLLPRLYDPTEGAVYIDGTDIRRYSLEALRQSIAIVQQEAFLFSDTVKENLLHSRLDATDEEIFAAAKAANAHDFIAELPLGYDTVLGERGVNLSGGQRQRISIARALLRNPRILILDEATSALDTESEFLVQEALNRLMKGRTCFIIAHRLSTIRNVDRIFVMCRGSIVESGSHDELMAENGLYARLIRHQTPLSKESGTKPGNDFVTRPSPARTEDRSAVG